MKFDAALPPIGLKDVPAIAKAAEEIGFDALWTQETQHDPFLPCSLIAEHTTRLRAGTAIAVSFSRSPANIAYTAWDLAAQSNGRFILGLGTQVKAHIERRFGQSWPESVTGKLREQIEVIRALWDCWQNGTKLNYRGEYYKITLMSPFFNPGAIEHPNIPIYIAGVNTGLAKLAGELCEGFHVHPFHSVKYVREVIVPAIGEGTRKEKSVMDLHGWTGVAEKLSAHAARGEWAEMPMLITDEILNEFCLMSDEENLADELKKRYQGIADRLTIYTPFVSGEKNEWWRRLAVYFNQP